MKSPLDILLPYQRAWVEDDSRFKIGLWARQIGKSFSCAAEAVRDCHLTPGTMWVVLSSGERQALEFMEKARTWAKAFSLLITDDLVEREEGGKEALLKRAEIRFPNGSRIQALPANANTARGYSANLILDEFAFHEDPDAIWRGIYPSISNPLRGEFKLRIVSTPNGRANKFYDLWTKNEHYSRHKVTIDDAVEQGLPDRRKELREGLDDPEGWAQEFLCEFIDASSVLLPYDLIAACESEEASETGGPTMAPHLSEIFLGVDIGRKRDLTVIWMLERARGTDLMWTRAVRVLERMPFREQLQIIGRMVRGCRRAAVDAQGIGAMLAEELGRDHGPKVEEVAFTQASKAEIFLGLRRVFDDRLLRVPVSRKIREDLHSMQKETTAGGQIKFVAARTKDGHADRATALGLAIRAATARPADVSMVLV